MENENFRYQPRCSTPGCPNPPSHKVAAPWNDANNHELKTYGLTCPEHRDALLARSRAKRQGLSTAEGEIVGTVGVYQLVPGIRDVDLPRVSD
jgi:hypothetical protein